MVNVSFVPEDVLSSLIMGIAISAAFPIGAVIVLYFNYLKRIRADIAAFGSGIFFAAISFSLVYEPIKEGNTITMTIGFIMGNCF
jgi:hypothetical protein